MALIIRIPIAIDSHDYHIYIYTSFLAGSFTCRTTTKIYAESYIHDLLYIYRSLLYLYMIINNDDRTYTSVIIPVI